MPKLTAVSALTLTLALGACSAEEPQPTIDLGESDDRISDFKFAPSVSEVLELNALKVESSVNVADVERGEGLLVTGPVYVVDAPDTGEMNLRVTTNTILDFAWLTDDLQFMLLAEKDGGTWEPLQVFIEYDRKGVPTLSKLDAFDELSYSVDRKVLSGENGAIGEFAEEDFALPTGRIGVFAIPASTWGDIRGDYSYKIEADCNDEICGEAPEEAAAPGDEPGEEPGEEPGQDPAEPGPLKQKGKVLSPPSFPIGQ